MSAHVDTVASSATRLDKWLWAARFFKTRNQAKVAIDGGKVHLNGARVKAAKDVHVGDRLTLTRGADQYEILVDAISERRGNATVAQLLYTETAASVERREAESARRKMESAGLRVPKTRPSKKDRRELVRLKSETDAD